MFRWIMTVFGLPLGYIMWAMYQIVHNYGLAILLFTIVTKLLLIPLAIKQQKSTVQMQLMQPKMEEIRNKYKNNPTKMNEEMQALYDRENYSMTAGCMPMLIQFPIIFGLLDVVYRPLTHLLHISSTVMNQATEIATELIGSAATAGYAPEIAILSSVKSNPAAYAALGEDTVQKIMAFDTHFLGLDLSVFPNQVIHLGFSGEALASMLNPVILIPILSGLTAFLMSKVTMKNSGGTANNPSMGAMMMTMPLMSLFFTFMVPASAGLYWTISNVVAMFQTMIMNHFWNPKEIAAKIKAEEEARKEKERKEKIEAKKRAKEQGKKEEETALSQKEINRRRLAEARRRNAEKYGDVYVEVTDDDLK